MKTRIYPKTGEAISLLGLGCMRFPVLNTEDKKIDYARAQEIVDYAYTHGINYFDTAYMYHGGESERFLGQALKKYPRESYFLTDKMPIWMAKTPDDLERIFQDQLNKCQTDYFDFYLFHSLKEEAFQKCVNFGLYEFLQKKKAEGKIHNLGFSFHDRPEVLKKIVEKYDWDFAQIQLNYLDWKDQDAEQQYQILTEHHLPVIVMEPVRGGALAKLSDKADEILKKVHPESSIASWAIRFAASQPNVMTVLSGMSTLEQIADNVSTMDKFTPLNQEELTALEQAVDAFRQKDRILCTGCRYCMDCPNGLDIPKMFRIFNEYLSTQDVKKFLERYDSVESERAENCVKCGICATHCPQSIDIPDRMQMISDLVKRLKEHY